MTGHITYAPVENCQNLSETYGHVCVLCNKCGRWDGEEE